MQKALTQVNIQLANVISDLSGWTGMRIVRAIRAGERDPQALAALSHPGIHASRDGEPSLPVTPEKRSGPKRRRKAGRHAPQFDLGRELHRISGVDLTRMDGIDVGVAQTVISEVGLDMARWATEHHFASWLGFATGRAACHASRGCDPLLTSSTQ